MIYNAYGGWADDDYGMVEVLCIHELVCDPPHLHAPEC